LLAADIYTIAVRSPPWCSDFERWKFYFSSSFNKCMYAKCHLVNLYV